MRRSGEVWLRARERLPTAVTTGTNEVLVRQGGVEVHQAQAHPCPDAQRARFPLGEGGHVGLRRVEVGDDRVRVAQQQAARLGEVDAARPARPGPL